MPWRAASRVVLDGRRVQGALAYGQRAAVNQPLSRGQPERVAAAVPVHAVSAPGLRRLATPPTPGIGRGLYQDSQGNLYCVVGNVVYYVDPNFHLTAVGAIAPGTSICSMADNGTTMILVDGTPAGYTIDVQSKVMAPIVDAAFYGGDRVDYVRTVFALNRPGPSSSIFQASTPRPGTRSISARKHRPQIH
jgi:hypothetical protein